MNEILKITGFSIEKLNEVFDYSEKDITGNFSDLIILYGDNGSGKTTVLQLVFNLLSSESAQGHLTYIGTIPFKSLEVRLSDGSVIRAHREEGVKSYPVIFRVNRNDQDIAEYRHIPDRIREKYIQEVFEKELLKNTQQTINDKRGRNTALHYIGARGSIIPNSDSNAHAKYLNALKSTGINCYLITTDRRIKNDFIEAKRNSSRSRVEIDREEDDLITRIRAQYLKEALSSAYRYINRQIIKASNIGSKNTNDIYFEIIRQIASENATAEDDVSHRLERTVSELEDLQKKNKKISDLGLVPELILDPIIEIVRSVSPSSKTLLEKILRPYIDSLSARLQAHDPIGEVIRTFLQILNGLLTLKKVSFSPGYGFATHGPDDKPLEVEQLSSGEQQLLLMFCYLLASNESPCIFMIDEPEISLNVKWQRELIDTMRRITKYSNNQLILATHSIELLTQYSDAVIDLNPTISEV